MSKDSDDTDNPDKSDESEKIKDPEYIAKAIKKFINEGDDNSAKISSAQPVTGKQFHDRRDIIKALTNLQLIYKAEYTPGQQVNINTDEFKSALLNSMAKLSNSVITKSLSQIDGRTIDFVEMLFGAFLRDPNVSDAMKTLLLQLQVPLIKIAMLDNQFFHNNKHPARNVLDTIAHLGIGIEDTDNTLYKTMALIIEQLLTTFEQNIISFNTALAALNRLTQIEKKKHEQQEAETHKEILKEHARQIILTELKHNTKGKSLPQSIKPLILNHWSNLMLHTFIRHGNEGEQWQSVTDTLKDLINYMQPIKSKIQLLLVKNNSEELIQKIKAKLYATQQNKESIDKSLDTLRELIQEKIEEASENKDTPETHTEDSSKEDEKAKQESEEKLRKAKEHLSQLPKEVKLGVWFEVYNGEGRPLRRLKLSIILFDEAKLVFVDRKGNKVIDKYATEFFEDLKAGRSRIIEDQSIFNTALVKVITGLLTSD